MQKTVGITIPCSHFTKHRILTHGFLQLVIIKIEIPIWHGMCMKNKIFIMQKKTNASIYFTDT
jgi:hypothetical protein